MKDYNLQHEKPFNVICSFLATRPGISGSEEVQIIAGKESGWTPPTVHIQNEQGRHSPQPVTRIRSDSSESRTFTEHSGSACHTSPEKTQSISSHISEAWEQCWQHILMDNCPLSFFYILTLFRFLWIFGGGGAEESMTMRKYSFDKTKSVQKAIFSYSLIFLCHAYGSPFDSSS